MSPPAVSRTNHSSGPSQNAVRAAFATEVFGFCGRVTPSARDSEATASSGTRSDTRLAGGSTATRTPLADTSCPASAGRLSADDSAFTVLAALAIEAFPLLVNEYRAGDLHLDGSVGHRHVKRFARSSGAAFHQRQRDGTAAIFRPVAGGNVAYHLHGHRLLRIDDDLRALFQHHIGIARLQA